MNLLTMFTRLPVSKVISALGQGLNKAAASLPYMRKTCTFLLSRQLLRPDGIKGLCESVFAEEDLSTGDVSLDKLEHVARLLSTIPSGMKAEVCFQNPAIRTPAHEEL